jgi:large subunit ribosomal protein L16
MLAPKRIKFRKTFKGKHPGIATRGTPWRSASSGLMSLDPGWITNRQIEASRRDDAEMKRGGKVWIRIFPDKPVTKKPAETRMGKGKGNPEGWVAVVKPGRMLFEVDGVPEEVARRAFGARRRQAPGEDAVRPAGGDLSDEGTELQQMSDDELRQKLAELTEERFRWGSGRPPRRSRARCGSGPCAGTSRGSRPPAREAGRRGSAR